MFGTQNDDKKQDTPLVNDQSFKDMANSTGLTMPTYADAKSITTTDTAPGTPGMVSPTAPPLNAVPPSPPVSAPSALSPSPLGSVTMTPISSSTVPSMTTMPQAPVTGADADLLNLKHEALSELSPLVSHIDQTPSEKFRTLMMMIQGADDKSLIKPAYEAAKSIEDEKERAQALLDIVNEINYFTQPKDALPGQPPAA